MKIWWIWRLWCDTSCWESRVECVTDQFVCCLCPSVCTFVCVCVCAEVDCCYLFVWRRCVWVWVCNALLSPLCFTCCPGNPKTPPCHAIGSAQPNELPAASNANQSRNGTDHMTVCVCVCATLTSLPPPPTLLAHLQLFLRLHVRGRLCSVTSALLSSESVHDVFVVMMWWWCSVEKIYLFSIYFPFVLACRKHICRHVQQKGFWATSVCTGSFSEVSSTDLTICKALFHTHAEIRLCWVDSQHGGQEHSDDENISYYKKNILLDRIKGFLWYCTV